MSTAKIIVEANKVVVRHVPEALVEKLFPLMKEWKLYKVTSTVTGEKRRTSEGNFMQLFNRGGSLNNLL